MNNSIKSLDSSTYSIRLGQIEKRPSRSIYRPTESRLMSCTS